jgi:hypothetical protein
MFRFPEKIVHEIHLYNHTDEHALQALVIQGAKIMALLDTLTAEVKKNSDVEDSAVLLLQGLKQKLDDAIASGNPAALQTLSDQLGAQTQKLADAVSANTPANAPIPAPTPSVPPTPAP